MSKLSDYKSYHPFSIWASSGLKPNHLIQTLESSMNYLNNGLHKEDIWLLDYFKCKTVLSNYCFRLQNKARLILLRENVLSFVAMLLCCNAVKYEDVHSDDFAFNTQPASRDFSFPITAGFEITLLKKIADKASNIHVQYSG